MAYLSVLHYCLELLMVSSIGILFYSLVLRREHRLVWNRVYLLLVSLISISAPIIEWGTIRSVPISYLPEFFLDVAVVDGLSSTGASTSPPYWWTWLACIFFLGVAVAAIRWAYRLISLLRFKAKCAPGLALGVARCYFTAGKIGPSSFGKWLFWDETLPVSEEEAAQILKHELCHIRQWHTLDLIWMDLCLIVLWWNPAFHWIRHEMVANHEAQADQAAIAQGAKRQYQHLLLRQWLKPQFHLTHEFIYSHTKHRIDMLTHRFTQPYRIWRYAMIAPVFFLMIVLGSCLDNKEDQPVKVIKIVPAGAADPVEPSDGSVPVPLNLDAIKRAIGYPEEARERGISGEIIVRVLVDELGKYQDHEIIQPGHETLQAAVEANVTELTFSPAVINGANTASWVNIPFKFMLIK